MPALRRAAQLGANPLAPKLLEKKMRNDEKIMSLKSMRKFRYNVFRRANEPEQGEGGAMKKGSGELPPKVWYDDASNSENQPERSSFMSVPESRERLFRYIEERGEVTFDALNQLITKENLDFGPGVYALDVLLGSDDWWRVSVDVDKKIVTAARAPLAAAR